MRMKSEYSQYSHMYYVKLAPGILRRLRKQKGLTQKELGQKVGVTAGTICNWERSLCTCSKRYIKALAQALDCTVDELSDGAESVTVLRRVNVSGIKPAPLPKANSIDQYRKACGLTVKELAQRMHVSDHTINLWKNGKVIPSAPKALLLAKTLGCTVSDLKIPGVFDFANFAYNLQRLRCERGLSRAELSFAIFGHPRTAGLGALERGKYSPNFAQITQIMQALNCTLDDLQLAPDADAPVAQKRIKTHSDAQSKLRHKRLERGLSQSELAQALGVHGDYISRWEVGASRPNAASMQKLCDFFHCSPDDLFITPSKSEEKS